ncbi:MAG: ATP-binding protein [Gammaproteobacteria bacterium]|nr:ATP-binding protein [Gammaproteobacteria bacterium]MYH15879.1 ATP-binding protein [Gammaproteobacteria bacterium]MYK81508.1 ATP-binding protein [Gammaproteobacteria bacterium]
MYSRSLEPLIRELLAEFRIVYLTGPRQAGKTTLARSVAEGLGMAYITLDDQSVFESIESDPHGFVRAFGSRRVVLDEFQYAPSLLPAIKEASDRLALHEKGKFLLTGSADIFRSARTQEALPGHMARLELLPLSITERSGNPLNLIDCLLSDDPWPTRTAATDRKAIAELLLRGGYPEVQDKSRRGRQAWFRSYMEGRLYKDFESLHAARGDYHSRLRALTPYLAGLSGNLLKYANVANDLELDDHLVKNYIEILELMFIVRRSSAYLKNRAKRRAAPMPKLHYIDTGLACHLLGLRSAEQLLRSAHYGGLLESLIYVECCKHADWADEDIELHHFRDRRKREVDIVLERGDSKIVGVEVKASASVGPRDFDGLTALADFSGSAFERGVVLYTGDKALSFQRSGRRFQALPIGVLMAGAG